VCGRLKRDFDVADDRKKERTGRLSQKKRGRFGSVCKEI